MTLKAQLVAIIASVTAAAIMVGVAVDAARSVVAAEHDALERQRQSLRTLATAMDYGLPEVDVDYDADDGVRRIAWAARPVFDDHTLIDRVGAATGETATIFVLDDATGEFVRRTTTIVADGGDRAVGTVLGRDGPVHAAVAAGEAFRGEAVVLGRPYYAVYQPILGPDGAVQGVAYVGSEKPNWPMLALRAATGGALGSVIGLALAVAVAGAVAQRVTARLDGLVEAMSAIGGGRLDAPVPSMRDGDALGALARSVETLRGQLSDAAAARADLERAAADALASLDACVGGALAAASADDFSARVGERPTQPELARIADGVDAMLRAIDRFTTDMGATLDALRGGDLTKPMAAQYEGRFGAMATALNASIEKLSDLVANIVDASEDGRRAVASIVDGAGGLSGRMERQAAALEQTAATMEQMASTVKTNAAALDAADALSHEVETMTIDGARTVEQAVAAVSEIKQGSDEIGEIISIIEGIAFQTNLLALNASVEAARAGEAGRGFAVVAAEVRALAQRTSESAQSVSETIQRSGDQVADGLRKVDGAGAALNRIRDASQTLSSRLSEVARAGSEQSAGIAEVSAGVADMDRMTQETAAMTDRFTREAAALSKAITALDDAAHSFHTQADAMAANARAA